MDPPWSENFAGALVELRRGHKQTESRTAEIGATNVPPNSRATPLSESETETDERVKRDVRGARVARLNRNVRPRERQLSFGRREEVPRDRERLSDADERSRAGELVFAGVDVTSADAALGVRDDGAGADAPLEHPPAD